MKNKTAFFILINCLLIAFSSSAQESGDFFTLRLPVKKLQALVKNADRIVFTFAATQLNGEDGYTLFGMAYSGVVAHENDTITLEAFDDKKPHIGKALQTGVFTLSRDQIDSLSLSKVDPIILTPVDYPGTNKKFVSYTYTLGSKSNVPFNPSPPAGGSKKSIKKPISKPHSLVKGAL